MIWFKFSRYFNIFLLAGYVNSGFAMPIEEEKSLHLKDSIIISKMTQNILQDSFIIKLLEQNFHLFSQVLSQREELGIQLIYSSIERGKNGKPSFTDYTFNLRSENYFYPASTVKLPVAILALQKLNELKIAGLDRNTTMITKSASEQQTEVYNDASASDGRPTIAHYIKKILLVSDNDAFNRLYEFLGQDYINNSLHKMGYTGVQIIHRLAINLTEEENRHTNPVKFIDTAGNMVYDKPGEKSKLVYADRNIKLGRGFMRGTELINEPFDFSKKNRLPLPDLHQMVKSILFPKSVKKEQRFNLTEDDYTFLRHYMSMLPAESKSPSYDTTEFHDNYVKLLFYGAEKTKPNAEIRIFNKPGWAYGFLTDACYLADFANNIEFMLSAVIYCNSDGVFNDDKYDYKTIGYPFLKNLGKVVYEYEINRKRKHPADLTFLKFSYQE